MKSRFILALCTSLIFFGCDGEKEKVGQELLFKNVNIQECIGSVDAKYIVLRTPKDVIVGVINQIEFSNNMIFVSTSSSDTYALYVFNKNGEYVKKIGNQGRGNGEYVYLDSFTITPDRISIVDSGKQKVINYDINTFEYINEMELPFEAACFERIDDETLVWNNLAYMGDELFGDYNFIITDSLGHNGKGYLNKDIKSGYSMGAQRPMYRMNDEVRVYAPFQTTIYTVSKETIVPLYNLVLDKFISPPVEFMKKESRDDKCYFDALIASGYISSWMPFETEDNLCVDFYVEGKGHLAIYNKNDNKGYIFSKEEFGRAMCGEFSYLIATDGEYFVSPIELEVIKNSSHIPTQLETIINTSDMRATVLFLFKI